MPDPQQLARFETGDGVIASLDDSGGAAPSAELLDRIHEARVRVITSPVFASDRVLAAVLSEGAMDREVRGRGIADHLWSVRGIVPLLRIDRGLEDERDGVRLARGVPFLDGLLAHASSLGVFGVVQRSLVRAAGPTGVERVLAQQFAIAERVLRAGLVPVIEPETDLVGSGRADAEALLRAGILARLAGMGDRRVAIAFPGVLDAHPNVVRTVALGGPLLDGLPAGQDARGFDRALDAAIARAAG